MKKNYVFTVSISLIAFMVFSSLTLAQDLKPTKLPDPQTTGGMPLMQALKERKTSREYSTKELPPKVLSNLLWAGFGISRPDEGKRTAPSASNKQEIDIYVTTPKGLYLYDAKSHTLNPVFAGDIRAATGKQSFAGVAPVNLVFVADLSKMGGGFDTQKGMTANVDTGFISQNVYLYCASEGLATVARGWFDREELTKKMKLRSDQLVILTQTVGYPK